MTSSVLERLSQVHPDMEIWWDSSPLVFSSFVEDAVSSAPPSARGLIKDELSRIYVSDDPAQSLIRGCTTNPPLALDAVGKDLPFWDEWVNELLADTPDLSKSECAWLIYKEVLRRGAEMMLPIWEHSAGRFGYISGQLDPRLITEADKMVEMAQELRTIAPNIMVKVPASTEGVEVVRTLTSMGIPTNVTTCFTLPQIWAVALAAKEGLAIAQASNVDVSKWRAVITMMIGRLTENPVLDEQAARRGINLSRVDKHWFGVHVFRKAFKLLRDNGLPSKMLACSMRPGPLVGGSSHFWDIEKIAGDIVYTMPPYVLKPLFEQSGGLTFNEEVLADDVPVDVMKKLERIPYVLQSWDANGMEVDQFNNHPATISTAKTFSAAFDGLEEYADKQLQARKEQVR
jgi:transaldolase